ncbi:hypothetical protein Tco_1530527 [Tanacetum coccineum]
MAGLQCNKQELLNATTSKVKDIWLGNVLSQSDQGMQHDPRILTNQAQIIIPHNAAFQTEDLDTYDSECDDLSTAQQFDSVVKKRTTPSALEEGTIRFGNDQIARIMGYGDYQQGNVVISRRQRLRAGYGTDDYLISTKLAKDGLVRGIPRLKFQKDHLCSACALGKSKKSSHQPKAEDTNQEKLYLLHMSFGCPMRVHINEKSIS